MTLTVPVDLDAVAVFLLVLARTSAWVLAVPLFSARGSGGVGRLGVGAILALFLTPLLPPVQLPAELLAYAGLVISQVVIGLALGLATALVLAAVEIAGSLADLASGFSYGSLIDPVTGAQSAAFARLSTVTFLALLFATEGYQTLLAGFARSFTALPISAVPNLSDQAVDILGRAVNGVFVAALEIGAPLLGTLFLTEVALGLASRFVPQANALVVGLPVKSLVALAAAGGLLTMLPHHLPGLVDSALRLGDGLVR